MEGACNGDSKENREYLHLIAVSVSDSSSSFFPPGNATSPVHLSRTLIALFMYNISNCPSCTQSRCRNSSIDVGMGSEDIVFDFATYSGLFTRRINLQRKSCQIFSKFREIFERMLR